ncbi:MAG: hypothetical protein HC800_20415 [Phormidesmis sp. RL_2_1]|nr:hypothetical protein [Phormidesmis sp. RL_2_1]
MKRKATSLLGVGTMLLLGSAATLITLQPAAKAQAAKAQPAIAQPAIAQTSTAQPAIAQLPVVQALLEDLALTEQQQQQLSSLRQSTRGQIETILTPEQKTQLLAIVVEGANIRETLAAMDITTEQRQEIRNVLQNSRADLQGILTPEQRTTLRQNVQAQWREFLNR